GWAAGLHHHRRHLHRPRSRAAGTSAPGGPGEMTATPNTALQRTRLRAPLSFRPLGVIGRPLGDDCPTHLEVSWKEILYVETRLWHEPVVGRIRRSHGVCAKPRALSSLHRSGWRPGRLRVRPPDLRGDAVLGR